MAKEIYEKIKKKVCKIKHMFSDDNSCYRAVFKELGISHLHTTGKEYTHMIEAVNSSIRDNLARFNRRSKRYSKCVNMLDDTLLLFFHHKKYVINNK